MVCHTALWGGKGLKTTEQEAKVYKTRDLKISQIIKLSIYINFVLFPSLANVINMLMFLSF